MEIWFNLSAKHQVGHILCGYYMLFDLITAIDVCSIDMVVLI